MLETDLRAYQRYDPTQILAHTELGQRDLAVDRVVKLLVRSRGKGLKARLKRRFRELQDDTISTVNAHGCEGSVVMVSGRNWSEIVTGMRKTAICG